MSKNIAIITGASSGLGREFVLQVAKRYPKLDEIWIIARRIDRLYELACNIEAPNAPHIVPLALDLCNKSDIVRFKRLLKFVAPNVYLLINSAGYGRLGSFIELEEDDQLGMIDLNCRALTQITYSCIPYMPSRSCIIQVASSAAFMSQKNFAIYSATKAYVDSFSLAIRRELAPLEINVTSVCPGPVETEFFQMADPEGKTAFYKEIVKADKTKVVRKALNDAARRKRRSIYGVAMKAFSVASRFAD